ncbi:Phosphoglucosamine mutase [bacterium HR19]|nr:Phosphoglucosamine mutase [bacterium HR19]
MKLFGTDGIRFVVVPEKAKGEEEIIYSPELIYKIALASSCVLREGRYVLVWDTRRSSLSITSIFGGVLSSLGYDVILGGVLPTPSVSAIVLSLGFDGGFSVSASHNPPHFNGIKFFKKDGFKADKELEEKIERSFLAQNSSLNLKFADLVFNPELVRNTYKSFVLSFFREKFLSGVKVVLDCSNGSTYLVAPEIFEELGANVKKIGCEPNGENINVGVGSEEPSRALSEEGDFKIIFDGDGDRVLIGDSEGNLFDGDHILSLLALFMSKEGTLKWGVVGTILSNSALEIFVRNLGLNFERVDVGDRNIAYRMKNLGANLGGEESGHIILSDILPTGDGIISALKVLQYVIKSGKDIRDLVIKKFYQAKGKIHVSRKKSLDSDEFSSIRKIEEEVKRDGGRVVIRYSGTEPVLRIMVEHEDKSVAEKYKDILVYELRKIFEGI